MQLKYSISLTIYIFLFVFPESYFHQIKLLSRSHSKFIIIRSRVRLIKSAKYVVISGIVITKHPGSAVSRSETLETRNTITALDCNNRKKTFEKFYKFSIKYKLHICYSCINYKYHRNGEDENSQIATVKSA